MAVVDIANNKLKVGQTFASLVVWSILEMSPDGGPVLFIVGSGPGVRLASEVQAAAPFETAALTAVATSSIEQITSTASNHKPRLVVGVGGGAVIDRGKVAAKIADARYLAIPTALSQDGLFSEHAVLRTPAGAIERFRCRPPDKVVPAVELIEKAPAALRTACVGDLLSNISAIEDCKLASAKGTYSVAPKALQMASQAAVIAADSDPEGSPMELFEAVKLSGQAMQLAGGSKPCSGAEHKIDHALNIVTGDPGVHGLSVAFATVFLAAMRSPEQLEKLVPIIANHGLPKTPEDLGIGTDDFVEAVLLANDLRPSRFTVLDQERPSRKQIVQVLDEVTKKTAT